jgi:hypothetical protein
MESHSSTLLKIKSELRNLREPLKAGPANITERSGKHWKPTLSAYHLLRPFEIIGTAFLRESDSLGIFRSMPHALAPRVRHQPLQVLDLLEVATLNCHYSSVI